MVVRLWIAEGLVHQPRSQKSLEKVGEEYFDELVSRSLIQRSSVDGEANFEMHDLMNDLATMVSSSFCIRLDEHELNERVRHLSYNRVRYDSYNKFDKLYALKGLRTFLSLPLQEQSEIYCSLSDKVLCDMLPTMKQLRVLSLSNYRISRLPKSIGNLIYLRYLDLSRSEIRSLPSVICKLYNLQTLLLSDCKYLTKLPKDMDKLVNLRHLDVNGSAVWEMPVEIARLENLLTLSHFVIGEEHNGLNVGFLVKFPHLKGKLSILQLENVTDPSDAFQANLEEKKEIDVLVLAWNSHRWKVTPSESQNESVVLERLRPSTNLKNLTIEGFGGNKFPNWLGDSLFGNMVYLMIWGCDYCSQLGNLKELHFVYMSSVKSVGAEFYGSGSSTSFQPFPSLEILTFSDMEEWEEWKLIGGTSTNFPTLRCLSLESCPKLRGNNILNNLPSLTELKLHVCPLLEMSGHSDDDNNSNIIIPRLSFDVRNLSSLQKLTLSDIDSPTSFPRDGLPKTLQSLNISKCKNLEFLPHESLHNYTSLEDLTICRSCNSMTSFNLGSLPVLKSLHLKWCQNLKSIVIVEDASQQSLSFLRSIKIIDCDELESFSTGGSGLPIPNLILFEVYECHKLQSLPEPKNTFPSLQELRMSNLPNLQCFAKEGLPINLRELYVSSSKGLPDTTINEWGLERLTCLTTLYIANWNMLKARMKTELPSLPASLASLYISELGDIKCLDGKWLRHLTSLQYLHISDAGKLKSLPEEGFPSSLSILSIFYCPLLEASLLRKRGKEWRKIAHIPNIVIHDKLIT